MIKYLKQLFCNHKYERMTARLYGVVTHYKLKCSKCGHCPVKHWTKVKKKEEKTYESS